MLGFILYRPAIYVKQAMPSDEPGEYARQSHRLLNAQWQGGETAALRLLFESQFVPEKVRRAIHNHFTACQSVQVTYRAKSTAFKI